MLIDDFNDNQNCHFDKLFDEDDTFNYDQRKKKSQLQISYSFLDFYSNNLINSIDQLENEELLNFTEFRSFFDPEVKKKI